MGKYTTKWNKIKQTIKPYLTLKMMAVFGTVWLITTGWAWVFLVLGPILHMPWMTKVGAGAQFVFWNPVFSEKLLTIPFSIWLYKKIFKEEPVLKNKKEEK